MNTKNLYSILKTIPDHKKGHITQIAWSPDNKILSYGFKGSNLIYLWNTILDELHGELSSQGSSTLCLAWCDPNKLVTGDENGNILFWNIKKEENYDTVKAHGAAVRSIFVSPTGLIASIGNDNLVCFLDHNILKIVQIMSKKLGFTWVYPSPENTCYFVVISEDYSLQLYDIKGYSFIAKLYRHEHATVLACSPDGKILASGGKDGSIRLGNIPAQNVLHPSISSPHTDEISHIVFSKDNRLMISKSKDNIVSIFDCENWKPIAVIKNQAYETNGLGLAIHQSKKHILASLQEDNTIAIIELKVDLLKDAYQKQASPTNIDLQKHEDKKNSIKKPVYISSVTIENIKCFREKQTLRLSNDKGHPSQWTIILGNNGTGKTTLLQIIASLIPTNPPYYKSGVFTNDFESKFHRIISAYGWNPIRSGVESFHIESSFFMGTELSKLTDQDDFIEKTITIDCKLKNRYYQSEIDPKLVGIPCFAYGATRRMGTGEQYLTLEVKNDPTANLFLDGTPLINAEEWLLKADYSFTKSFGMSVDAQDLSESRKQRYKIHKILIDILPDVDDIRIFENKNQNISSFAVECKTPYGWISIKDMSLGYKTLIAWVVDLAAQLFEIYPNSNDPLSEPAIILIDEIDLHLHPEWQRKLTSDLTNHFKNTQFIATSHSPLVVQAATDANIVLLRKENDQVIIDNDVENIRGWRVDQILVSDLFGLESNLSPDLDELMKERQALLGKGKLTDQDLERLQEIKNRIGYLPVGDTIQDMKTMNIIHRAAKILEKKVLNNNDPDKQT